jgi:hypothetical protein
MKKLEEYSAKELLDIGFAALEVQGYEGRKEIHDKYPELLSLAPKPIKPNSEVYEKAEEFRRLQEEISQNALTNNNK